ncbi:uncharacterized protein LOC133184244 [Saccostrea echinata]|uniref:uncharacterized protein LOC133184244 n=1 Tax=Saccostrea echinata TaxID=191078 RepID=UPI002A82FB91|nr:uncharacterized protein LOC133184244 [Saccostrea echinata]
MEIPEQLLVCGFCHNSLESPKLLPCLHTVCWKCLATKREGLTKCTTCQQPIEGLDTVPSLPDDKFSKSLIDFARIPNEIDEETTESLSKILEELETQQNAVSIDLKKLRVKSEEASFGAFKNERNFFKVKKKAENEIKLKITDLRKRFDKYLLEKEIEMMEELDNALDDEEFDLSQSVIWNRSVMGSIENKEELLNKCNLQSLNSAPKALAYKRVLTEMKDHISHIGGSISKKNPTNLEINFKYNQDIEDVFTKPVGSIEIRKSGNNVEEEAKRESATAPFENAPYKNAVYLRTFPSLLPEDSKGYVVGIAWVPPDRLVLVDKWNGKLKLFDENGRLINVMVFSGGEPTDIVYTKGTNIRHLCLVTIPSGRLILQVAVEENIIRLSSRIVTVTGYSSIAYDKVCAKLICGVCQPYGTPRIDIVSANGVVEFTIATDLQRRPHFICPRSIDIFLGIIAGCDWQKNRILFIARDGSIRGSYYGSPQAPLMNPVGTTLDGRDHLLVADCKRNKIHIVSSSGEHLGIYDTSDHVKDPREINVIAHENSAKLAVSHGAGYVSIYQLTDTPPEVTLKAGSVSSEDSHKQ